VGSGSILVIPFVDAHASIDISFHVSLETSDGRKQSC